jgi:hypothetical protein
VTGAWRCHAPHLRSLLALANDTLSRSGQYGFARVLFGHVLRGDNADADALCNVAMDSRADAVTLLAPDACVETAAHGAAAFRPALPALSAPAADDEDAGEVEADDGAAVLRAEDAMAELLVYMAGGGGGEAAAGAGSGTGGGSDGSTAAKKAKGAAGAGAFGK